MDDAAPPREREAVRAGEERPDVEAVRRDDCDRREEEDAEPGERQPEQARRQEAPSQAAFTSSHAWAYTARRGTSRSRYAFGNPTACGFVNCRTFSRSLEDGRAVVFACP